MRTKIAATILAIAGLGAAGATPAIAATHHAKHHAAAASCTITLALITRSICIPLSAH